MTTSEMTVDTTVSEQTAPAKKTPNFAKMGTNAIKTAIEGGKYEGDTLTAAQKILADRLAKPSKPEQAKKDVKKTLPKAKPSKAEKQAGLKKPAGKKAAIKKTAGSNNKGVSEYLRKIMTPKEGSAEAKTKTCAVTYGEANRKVKDKFPERKKLYPSEFDRNFEMLKTEGVLLKKQPPQFKTAKEKAEKA